MQYLLLTIVVFMVAAQNIVEKQYNVKVQNGNTLLFAGLSSLVAMLFFVISSGLNIKLESSLIGYSVAFAAAYSLCNIGIVQAIGMALLV